MTRQWLQQFVGVLLLAFLAWAFLNTPDERAWHLALSGLAALAAVALGTWLIATNFHGTVALRRYFAAAAVLLALLAVLLALAQADEAWRSPAATWLASAISLRRRKPFSPAHASQWIGAFVFLLRWLALPLVFLPLIRRAAGAGPLRYGRFVLLYLAAFALGAVVPHYIVHWVPKLAGFWPQVLSAALRFLLAYALLITAWVLLGRSTRGAAPS